MKLLIENSEGTKIVVKIPTDSLHPNKIIGINNKMIDMLKYISHEEIASDIINTDDNKTKVSTSQNTVKNVVKDTHIIRPRIPNNVVDIKDLTIKQAVTEQALVRCPHCGQSHVLAVNSGENIYMMRKFYNDIGNNSKNITNEFKIIAEFDSLQSEDFVNMCCKPETDRKAYFEDIQTLPEITDKDFTVNNDTEIFCSVCCKSDTFGNWKEAYDNPLQYFETEHLCDACGGEKLEKMIKKTTIYQCEQCGLQSVYKEK